MVETSSGSTWKQFVFQPDGSLLAVFNDTTGLVQGTIPLHGGSSAIYDASGLSYIRHKDWLGSSRLATTWNHTVYSKEAYAPFGETYNESGTPDRSFTGQDQDVVTGSLGSGVYDYLFRKYDPSAGRWLSPDPYGWNAVRLRHPQSLNRYAYVQNNPLSMVDPTGLDCTGVSVGDDANDGCDGSNGGNDGTGCDNPSGCVTVTDNEPADPDCSDGSCDSCDWSGGFFPWGDGGNGSNGGIISPSSGGGGGGKPCLVGAGPLQVGQSRCPPKMPPGSNLLSTDCNSAIGAISATYSVSGAPGGAASTSWNGLFPGGQCQPRGPGFNCYSAPIGNGCTVTYCPPYNLQFQQAAPALYVPKGTNLPQMSSQCTTIIP